MSKEFNLPEYVIIPLFILQDEKIDVTNGQLFAYLYGLAHSGKEIYVSNAYLAKLCKISKPNIIKRLQYLESLKYIQRESHNNCRYIRVLHSPFCLIKTDNENTDPSGNVELEKQKMNTLKSDPHIASDTPPHIASDTPLTSNINNINKYNSSKISVDLVKKSTNAKDYKLDDLFMAFYNAYPNKQKPSEAHKAFLKHNPTPSFVKLLLDDLNARTSQNWKYRDKSKIPFPATYLNGREWEGEIFKPKSDKRDINVDSMDWDLHDPERDIYGI